MFECGSHVENVFIGIGIFMIIAAGGFLIIYKLMAIGYRCYKISRNSVCGRALSGGVDYLALDRDSLIYLRNS